MHTDTAVASRDPKFYHSDGRIICQIDNAPTHSIQLHIKNNHPDWTLERYQEVYKDAPLMSDAAKEAVRAKREQKERVAAAGETSFRSVAEVFGLPAEKTRNERGNQIQVRVFNPDNYDADDRIYVPDVDKNYVFDIPLIRVIIMGLELNKPMYLWGLHGTGKTTNFEQVAAHTGRPFMRVQHTANMEESHVLGQWVVVNGEMVFALGPLAIAMKNGYVYCADEYDVAMPAVVSLYQPVLEGKPLIIKEAPPELRVIRPHPNFRFCATGNTNGSGDETGLYQGTTIQNAANYSRFAITVEVDYPEPNVEAAIIAGQSGAKLEEARKLVNFATEVRKSFRAGTIGQTVSPRELINAASNALARGSDWVGGLELAFTARLARADKETCNQFAQRFFGGK